MSNIIYWFRNDLRLEDNHAFNGACLAATHLLPIYIHADNGDDLTSWGFPRFANHPRQFLQQSLYELRHRLTARGSTLVELNGKPAEVFRWLKEQAPFDCIYCEQIQAPEEISQVDAVMSLGFDIR